MDRKLSTNIISLFPIIFTFTSFNLESIEISNNIILLIKLSFHRNASQKEKKKKKKRRVQSQKGVLKKKTKKKSNQS